MFKQMIIGQRGYFQMVHGVTLKLIESVGDEDLDFRLKPGMRSVRDLILHIYGVERSLAEGVREAAFPMKRRTPRSRRNRKPPRVWRH